MDPPSPFQFPARDSQPLHQLSPECVNGTTRRPKSSMSRIASKSSAVDSDYEENRSAQSSPTRKANLFADYNPRSPSKESSAFQVAALAASPSLPEFNAFRTHARTNSDVQGLVKRFEHLDVRDKDSEYSERRKRHELELRRAQIAREEAESDCKRLREDMRRLEKEGSEGRDRERKVGKRLEVVMEEYARYKETYASQSSVYEKEVRKARKECFKSSSAIVKLQEELKSTTASLRNAQSKLEMEKRKVQQREQQSFDAQYQLVAVQEELDKLRAQMKVVEEEKEALKTSLKEEEVARIAAEGMIALPMGNQEDDDLMSPVAKRRSPQKRPASPLSDDKENAGVVTKKMVEFRQFHEELLRERMRREHAEELADFLRLECQFRCCSCRTADHRAAQAVSNAFSEAMESITNGMKAVLTPPASVDEEHDIQAAESQLKREMSETETEAANIKQTMDVDVEMENAPAENNTEDLDRSVTTAEEAPEARQDAEQAIEDDDLPESETPMAPLPTPVDPEPEKEEDNTMSQSTRKIPLAPSSPRTPAQQPSTPYHAQRSVRTITTTTTVPMHFTPIAHKPVFFDEGDVENIPPAVLSPRDRSGSAPSFDREAALAAIAYRRGRAKSIANGHATPRKQMIDTQRRDISAPALGQVKMPGAGMAKGDAARVGRGGRKLV